MSPDIAGPPAASTRRWPARTLAPLHGRLYSRDQPEVDRPGNSQRRAIEAHRRRLAERGLGRFEVRGLTADKDLIRGIARRLAANDGADEPPRVGGILAALRRSPLVDADLDVTREETGGRDAGL